MDQCTSIDSGGFRRTFLMAGATLPKVRCPQCGEDSLWSPENTWRPFCSERCKLIDLGCWADESYRVPVQEADGSAEDGVPPLE